MTVSIYKLTQMSNPTPTWVPPSFTLLYFSHLVLHSSAVLSEGALHSPFHKSFHTANQCPAQCNCLWYCKDPGPYFTLSNHNIKYGNNILGEVCSRAEEEKQGTQQESFVGSYQPPSSTPRAGPLQCYVILTHFVAKNSVRKHMNSYNQITK